MMVGGTSSLSGAEQQLLAPLLVRASDHHPWPSVIGGGRAGYWGGKDIDITRVEPETVVEVAADRGSSTAVGALTTFVRPRPDLRPGDTAWPR
jgi:hypothetical protein